MRSGRDAEDTNIANNGQKIEMPTRLEISIYARGRKRRGGRLGLPFWLAERIVT
jgi:hypothetical protein